MSSSDDELSVEQRLIMQLSAAMNQEEALVQPVEKHNEEEHMNLNDLSQLLGSIGQLGSLDVSHADEKQLQAPPSASRAAPQPPALQQTQDFPTNAPPPSSSQTSEPSPSQPSQPSSNDLLTSLLGGSSNGPINLSNINLADINLKDISLETLNNIGKSMGVDTASYFDSNRSSLDLASRSLPRSTFQPAKRTYNQSTTPYRDRLQQVPSSDSSSIDPEVSTIQSVLQSLLGGESIPDAQPETELDIAALGLGTEDQNLIDSLRSAISGVMGESNRPQLPTAASSVEFSLASRSRVPASKPKRQRVTRIPKSSTLTKPHSEFNASDPDTLRAIQQALLSALGPSAASTSLAESLTSMTSGPSTETSTEINEKTHLKFSGFRAVAGSTAAAAVAVAKKLAPKTTNVTEMDKQKLREENAARKRKWREENLLQNKDNDLRIRISKRANELYGEKESEEKFKWIEEEFTRRRQRRILRAGINSIVESAKARAAKAADDEANVSEGGSYLPYGRLNDQARTLAQQSKQAAKTHLSQLFRNSNAVLEPQLHSEKVTVPLAPYMLVASPKRPPYKIPLVEEVSDKTEVVTVQPKETQSKTEENESKDNSTDKKNQVAKLDKEDASKEASKETVQDFSTGNEKEKPEESGYSGYIDRPKHRYALIGALKLGSPPNLISIYYKIRGTMQQP